MNAALDSLEIANEFINVKFGKSSALALLQSCNRWMESHQNAEAEMRAAYKGNRMLPCQLDLLDKALDRVAAVRRNCVRLVRAEEVLAA
jgi:hypothetical protein